MNIDNLKGLSIDDLASGDIDKPDDWKSDLEQDDFINIDVYEDWSIDNQKDKNKNSGLFRGIDGLAGGNMNLNSVLDKQSNAADKIQSNDHKSLRQKYNIPDSIVDEAADIMISKFRSCAKTYVQTGKIPDDVKNDVTKALVAKIIPYVNTSGRQSDDIINDVRSIIADMYGDINAAMTRKMQSGASKSDQNSAIIPDKQSEATADKSNTNNRRKLQSDFVLNQPAVNGVFNAGYVLCNLRVMIKDKDHVIVLGTDADNIDSTYERFKSFGAEMQSNGSKSFTISYGNGYIFVGSNNDGKIDYINVVGLEALKVCNISWYKYGDTLDSFIARHGEPGDKDRDNGVDCITYYGDSTYKQTIQLSASDGHMIDEVAILFK